MVGASKFTKMGSGTPVFKSLIRTLLTAFDCLSCFFIIKTYAMAPHEKCLPLLHSERAKLHAIFVSLNAIGFNKKKYCCR